MGLSKCYEAFGQPQKALVNYKLYHQIADSLINRDHLQKFAKMESEYSFEKKQDSLKQVEAKKQLLFEAEIAQRKTKQQRTLAGLGLAGLLLLVLLYFYRLKQKNNQKLIRLNHQLNHTNLRLNDTNAQLITETQTRIELEKSKLQSEIALEKNKLQSEIDLKNQRLASHALHILQKNQTLKELKTVAKQIQQQRTMKNAKILLRKLDNLTNYGVRLDKDWEDFHNIFEQLYFKRSQLALFQRFEI